MTDDCCICRENFERMVLLKDYYKCECKAEICLDCLLNVKDTYDCPLCKRNLRKGTRTKIRYNQEQISFISNKIEKEIQTKREIQKNIDDELWGLRCDEFADLMLKSVSGLFISYLLLTAMKFNKMFDGLVIIFLIIFCFVYLKHAKIMNQLDTEYWKLRSELNILGRDKYDVMNAFNYSSVYEEEIREMKDEIKNIERRLIDYEDKTHSVFQKYLRL